MLCRSLGSCMYIRILDLTNEKQERLYHHSNDIILYSALIGQLEIRMFCQRTCKTTVVAIIDTTLTSHTSGIERKLVSQAMLLRAEKHFMCMCELPVDRSIIMDYGCCTVL